MVGVPQNKTRAMVSCFLASNVKLHSWHNWLLEQSQGQGSHRFRHNMTLHIRVTSEGPKGESPGLRSLNRSMGLSQNGATPNSWLCSLVSLQSQSKKNV